MAWVADIKGDQILIEEYNYGFPSTGNYHTRWINKNDPDNYIHFKDIEVQVPIPTGVTTVKTEGSVAIVTSTLKGSAE